MRSVLVGAVLCAVIAAGEPFGVMVLRGSPLAADYSTGWALFLFFIVTLLLNPGARLLTGSGLRRSELITIYIMMVVACAIPSWGLAMNLVPLLAGFFYYATPENDWMRALLSDTPTWLLPWDPEATRKLFEGMAQGEALPWGVWIAPLVFWCLFILALHLVCICILVILRKQWVEGEKLLFPLAVLPLEMSAGAGERPESRFLRNPVMWCGFLVPATINTINALHRYVEYIPPIDLNATVMILRNAIGVNCTPRFEVIGLSYLLSLDVSLGVWVFALLAVLQTGTERLLGWSIGPVQPFSDPASPSVAHLAFGALLFLVCASFWNARRHLKDVVRKAIVGAPEVDDSEELLPYRVAVCGSGLGTVAAIGLLMATGMNARTAVVFLLSALVIYVGLARIISQTGLAYGRATVAAPIFTVNVLGSALVEPPGLTSLGLNFAWAADVRTFVMASVATGLKLAKEGGLESGRLVWAILVAMAVALVVSVWVVIELAYAYGGINLAGWQFIGLPEFAGNWVNQNINNPEAPRVWHLGFTGIGAAAMGVLLYVKTRFVGFPIHPIGMTLGLTHPIYHVWFSVFVAWVFKALILKYGGPAVYQRLRPFFLGMTLGVFSSAGIWLVIDWATGMTGNVFTLG